MRKIPKKVAIACQGGGSHTAFTAGVLNALLSSKKHGKQFRIVALSGTSGGALCAGIAWSWLLHNHSKAGPSAEQAALAASALEGLWADLACEPILPAAQNELWAPLRFGFPLPHWVRGPFDYLDTGGNLAGQAGAAMFPFSEFECKQISQLTRKRLEQVLARHTGHFLDGVNFRQQLPRLRIGATNICEGFSRPISMEDYDVPKFRDILLASASIPPLFQPAKVDGHWYWDGLYSHNPPVECLANPTDIPGRHHPDWNYVPEEIWVIQINPPRSVHPPKTVPQLIDRRNELIGNLTLLSEMYHIDAMNWLITNKKLRRGAHYKPIALRLLSLKEDLPYASKYDRSRKLIQRLFREGQKAASQFFEPGSLWPMHGQPGEAPEGVHMATLAGGNDPSVETIDLSSSSVCEMPCLLRGFCAIDGVKRLQEGAFGLGEECLKGHPSNFPAQLPTWSI